MSEGGFALEFFLGAAQLELKIKAARSTEVLILFIWFVLIDGTFGFRKR
jgi:hypothetical protein